MAIQQSFDDELRELALFAGAGGGILGGKLLGWRTVCAVESASYPASVLAARQNDGTLDPFPIWDDVRTFKGRPWRGIVDVVSGGFPCQDISAAGKGKGLDGERSGLWREMARIIGEVRPRFAFVENSPRLASRGLGRVLGDLAALGYDAEWCVLGADDVGAPHLRERIWILAANPDGLRRRAQPKQPKRKGKADPIPVGEERNASYPSSLGCEQGRQSDRGFGGPRGLETWWSLEPPVGRVVHGLAHRMDRIKALGNGQVPSVARLAWEILREAINK